jgi:uncharacterized membrane protein
LRPEGRDGRERDDRVPPPDARAWLRSHRQRWLDWRHSKGEKGAAGYAMANSALGIRRLCLAADDLRRYRDYANEERAHHEHDPETQDQGRRRPFARLRPEYVVRAFGVPAVDEDGHLASRRDLPGPVEAAIYARGDPSRAKAGSDELRRCLVVGEGNWHLGHFCAILPRAMSLFVILKFLHVLLAIIAVGFNATYGVWLARVAREPVPTQSFVLKGIKRLDDWFANPAYVLLAVTGVTMVFIGELRFTTFWIAGGIVLWAIAVALGFFVYTPMLRNQIHALETAGPEDEGYKRYAANARFVGILLAVIVVVIVFLMVTKPTLS